MSERRQRSTTFCRPRPEAVAAVLGTNPQTWTGGSENVRNRVWRADAEGVPLWVMVSRQGASYEIEHAGNPWDGTIPDRDVKKALRWLEGFEAALLRANAPLVDCAPGGAGDGDAPSPGTR